MECTALNKELYSFKYTIATSLKLAVEKCKFNCKFKGLITK